MIGTTVSHSLSQLPESAFKDQLFGLNLLLLLSQNRVAEFHTELELLPADQIQSNVYIRHPVSLEQYLMEGNYNKVSLIHSMFPITLTLEVLVHNSLVLSIFGSLCRHALGKS